MHKLDLLLPFVMIPFLTLAVIVAMCSFLEQLSLTSTHHMYGADNLRYNYAAIDAGAKVLDTSPKIFGAKSILNKSSKPLLVPCSQPEKWVDISLSEDILLDSFEIVNAELYTSEL